MCGGGWPFETHTNKYNLKQLVPSKHSTSIKVGVTRSENVGEGEGGVVPFKNKEEGDVIHPRHVGDKRSGEVYTREVVGEGQENTPETRGTIEVVDCYQRER